MKPRKKLNIKRKRRTARVAARIAGTATEPRLVVNRSNRYVYAQLIDDAKGITLAAVSSFGKAGPKGGTAAKRPGGTKSEQAFAAGEALAMKAVEKGITTAVFDRRSSKFHGRVKSFADGAKKGGLKI
jgi:large subunit ribosomal protein L18